MRRTAALLVSLLALSFGLAGCGGGEEASPTPETVEGTLPEQTTTEGGGGGSTLEGDAANGEKIFASAGCGGCHTLEAAGSSGSVGPNLDDAAPSYDHVVTQVTEGGGAMPSFKDKLTEQQIQDVAAFVSGS